MEYIQNTKEMLIKARKEGYAVPAFNIHNLETIQTVVDAAVEMKSPVILAATPGTMDYAGRAYIQAIAEVAAKENNIPIDRKSTRLNSSHVAISYAVFC